VFIDIIHCTMNLEKLYTALRSFINTIYLRLQENFPGVLVALLLITVGIIVAKLLKLLSRRLINGLFKFIKRIQPEMTSKMFPGLETTFPIVVGEIVFWGIIILFTSAATETLDYPIFTNWLSNLVKYLPSIFAGIFIVFAGVIIGNVSEAVIHRTGTRLGIIHATWLGTICRISIIFASIMVAMDQVGLDVKFLALIIGIALGSIGIGISLAFSFGAKVAVSNLVATHYIQEVFKQGQVVRIGETEGRILEIKRAFVIIDTQSGTLTIPASRFLEENVLIKNNPVP
jgi:hypothetical protein